MFINTFTFLVIVIAVLLMKISPQFKIEISEEAASFKENLIKGYLYIWHNNRLRMLIYLGMISSLYNLVSIDVFSCICLSDTTIPMAVRLGHLSIWSSHETSVTI